MDSSDPFGSVSEKIHSILKENEFSDSENNEDEIFALAYKIILKNEDVENAFDQISSMENMEKKDLEKAIQLRAEGNRFYQQGKLSESLSCYNDSIMLAPCSNDFDVENNSVDFAMGLTNRAAVLGIFKVYKEAAEDLEIAVKSGYPKNLIYKVYKRLAEAYEGLGNQHKAIVAYKNLMDVLDISDIAKEKIENMKNDIIFSIKSLESDVATEHDLRQLAIKTKHPEISTFPKCIEIKQTTEKGRHIVRFLTKSGVPLIYELWYI